MPLPEGNIVQGKIVQKQVIRCRFHDKENRYELALYPEENLLIYRCLLCHRGDELLRYQMPKERTN